MTGVVDGCEWSLFCVVGVRLMSGEWMDGGDLWSLIPLSFIYFILLSLLFYSHSIPSIHILSYSAISYYSILSTLFLIPFISISLLFLSIAHSIYALFIIELVMVEVWTIPFIHSFTIHTHPSLSLHSSFRQPSLLIHFLFTPFHHTHTHVISLHSSYTLQYHFHYHLTISHSCLLPFFFILYYILSFYIILFTLIHTILSITMNSLYSTLSILSIYYLHHTLYTIITFHSCTIQFTLLNSLHPIHHHSKHTLTIQLLHSSTILIQYHSLFYTTHHSLYTSSFYSYYPIITITQPYHIHSTTVSITHSILTILVVSRKCHNSTLVLLRNEEER